MEIKIGERLKIFRTNHLHLNQEEFAKLLGVKQHAISYYEQGKNELSFDALIKLSEKGLNIEWLLTGNGEMLSIKIKNNNPKFPKLRELLLKTCLNSEIILADFSYSSLGTLENILINYFFSFSLKVYDLSIKEKLLQKIPFKDTNNSLADLKQIRKIISDIGLDRRFFNTPWIKEELVLPFITDVIYNWYYDINDTYLQINTYYEIIGSNCAKNDKNLKIDFKKLGNKPLVAIPILFDCIFIRDIQKEIDHALKVIIEKPSYTEWLRNNYLEKDFKNQLIYGHEIGL